MKNIIGIVLILLISCDDNTKLKKARDSKCGTPCYDGNSLYAGKGICKFGKLLCDDDGNVTSCDGWVNTDGTMQCNGLDNNCDGIIDSFRSQCRTACGDGFQTCLNGQWVNDCTAKTPSQEICDGLDNDCDGLTDEYVDIGIKYCYSGDPSELTVPFGDCRPGVLQCQYGKEECAKQKLPTPELCGDNIDNDCDGTVDNGSNFKHRDIVIIVDESCSMSGIINNIKSTTRNWALKYSNRKDLKFALESCPGPISTEDNQVILRQNLTDATTFNYAASRLYSGNTGYEPTIDAVYLTSDKNNPLGLNWTSDSEKTLILFGDEEPQTASKLSPKTTIDAANMAADAGVKVFIFASPVWTSSYQQMANQGKVYDLYMPPTQMESELDLIVNACN